MAQRVIIGTLLLAAIAAWTEPALAQASPSRPSAADAIPAECTQKADAAKAVTACTMYLKELGKSAGKAAGHKLASAHASRAAAYSAQGLHKHALSDISRALYQSPKDATLWHQRGQIRMALGQNVRCAADFAIALKHDPKRADSLVGRGDCFRRIGALPKAIEDANAALKLDPKSASAYAMRGYANLRLGKADQAVADSEEAIKLDPNTGRAYLTRGLALEAKDKVKAEADVRKAVALDPSIKTEKGMVEILKRFGV